MDNLNRATTIGGVSRTYDVLGNTLTIGSSKSMAWDVLNRMTSFTNGSATTNYQYRADGMRVAKSAGSDVQSFYYDGQMPIEDAAVVSSATTVTRNGLGARGIDFISTTTSSGTNVAYPIYDGHGNMVATLAKNGSGYTIGNRRSFGAWGEIRQGATTGSPNGRYCANLGHLDDDESGLTYMRARYYESGSGRFLSEDRAMEGLNWFSYCANNPNDFSDVSGNAKGEEGLRQLLALLCSGTGFVIFVGIAAVAMFEGSAGAKGLAIAACVLYSLANACFNHDWKIGAAMVLVDFAFGALISTVLDGAAAGKKMGGHAAMAVLAVTAYSLLLIGEIIADWSANGTPFSE